MFVEIDASDADGRDLLASCVTDGDRAADRRVDDANVDALGSNATHGVEYPAHAVLDTFEMGGHLIPVRYEVGEGKTAGGRFHQQLPQGFGHDIDGVAAKIDTEPARRRHQAGDINGDGEQEEEGDE